MAKNSKEEHKTAHNVFDNYTNRNLFKLISEGHFSGLVSPVFVGKESNVFLAKRADGEKVIVKIYRLETSDFNRMYDYLKYDTRFQYIKRNRRQIIFTWARREYRNLLLAREGEVRVPTPITIKDNILVMEYIGDDEIAPRLKDRTPKNAKKFYEDVIKNMKKLHKLGLTHGDLSEFNILNYNEKAVFIDFSQASPVESTRADELLERDAKNIAKYFTKIGYPKDFKKIMDFVRS